MSDTEWSQWIGVRRLIGSLVWRGALATALYAGTLYGFLMFLQSVVTTHNARQFVVFNLVAGVMTGVVISWRLTEAAGFVSMLVTLPAVLTAGLAILAGTSVASLLSGSPLDAELRFMLVGLTLIVAGLLIVRATLWE